jgi:hypothetical protein
VLIWDAESSGRVKITIVSLASFFLIYRFRGCIFSKMIELVYCNEAAAIIDEDIHSLGSCFDVGRMEKRSTGDFNMVNIWGWNNTDTWLIGAEGGRKVRGRGGRESAKPAWVAGLLVCALPGLGTTKTATFQLQLPAGEMN